MRYTRTLKSQKTGNVTNVNEGREETLVYKMIVEDLESYRLVFSKVEGNQTEKSATLVTNLILAWLLFPAG